MLVVHRGRVFCELRLIRVILLDTRNTFQETPRSSRPCTPCFSSVGRLSSPVQVLSKGTDGTGDPSYRKLLSRVCLVTLIYHRS